MFTAAEESALGPSEASRNRPQGRVLSFVASDVSGLGSTPATFPATVRGFTAQTQPFETTPNPAQVWFLDFSRDVEDFTFQSQANDLALEKGFASNHRTHQLVASSTWPLPGRPSTSTRP